MKFKHVELEAVISEKKVVCSIFGQGKITRTKGTGNFPLVCQFKSGVVCSYTTDGRLAVGGKITLTMNF